MQVSGGRLLSPVQKLVTTSIFLSCGGKEKCKSSPASRTKETVERLSLFLSVDPGQNRSPLKFLIEGNPRGFFVSCKQSLSIRNYFRLFSSTPSATGLVLPGLLRFEEWMNIQPAEYVKTRIWLFWIWMLKCIYCSNRVEQTKGWVCQRLENCPGTEGG